MRSQSGFTLIELLISMTLLGLLFVLLFGGLRFGMRAWERGTTTTGAVDTVRITQDLLRSEIERACPRSIPATRPQDPPRVDFAGAPAQLRLLAPAPAAAGGQRCAPTALAIQPDGSLERLVFTSGVNPSDGADLLRHAQSIAFAYLGTDGVWQSGWRDRTTLPLLVRLRVTFPVGDKRQWPELFIAPRISAEADCTYDPATQSCRGG